MEIGPNVDPDVTSLGQYRWDPVPHTGEKLTWLTGMRTMTTAGDVNTQVGMASHIYLVTESMKDAYFFSADSELLVVPQEGPPAVLATELGIIDLEPKEIAIIPRGLALSRRSAGRPRPRLRLRKLRPEIRASGPRPDRCQLHGQPARLQGPRGGL